MKTNFSSNQRAFTLVVIALCLAFVVMLSGAYTRMKDAGLGCPDWPGCYGSLTPPSEQNQIEAVAKNYPNQVLNLTKAWIEMLHRYLASALGVIILIAMFLVIRKQQTTNPPITLAWLVVGLVFLQALLGQMTVSMKLWPIIVTLHLQAAMTLLSLLLIIALRLKSVSGLPVKEFTFLRVFGIFAFLLLVVQIFLGGLTSTNSAGLICADFPYCNGELFPVLNLTAAYHFVYSMPSSLTNSQALITVHMLHRLGAFLNLLFLTSFVILIFKNKKLQSLYKLAGLLLSLVFLQIFLGVINIKWLLPIPIALAHNGVATLLLLTLLTINYRLNRKRN